MTLPPLFARLPEPFAAAFDPERPWLLLGEPMDDFFAALPSERIASAILPGVHLVGDRIAIGKGCRIAPTATIEGPIWMGDEVEIRPGACLRGGCWLGDGAVVGSHSEVKRGLFLPRAHAPHQNYVGDSILGERVNLGAGTILSNFRHDGREIRIASSAGPIATGRRKLGALLGDGVATGCNSVLHPGTVVGAGTHLYPGVQLRSGVYPAGSVIKLRQELEIVPRST